LPKLMNVTDDFLLKKKETASKQNTFLKKPGEHKKD
jgi:hypothetical protein